MPDPTLTLTLNVLATGVTTWSIQVDAYDDRAVDLACDLHDRLAARYRDFKPDTTPSALDAYGKRALEYIATHPQADYTEITTNAKLKAKTLDWLCKHGYLRCEGQTGPYRVLRSPDA